MKYGIYAIQDTLIGFGGPFLQKDEALAKRSYSNFLEENKNPSDQRLYYLGEFDDETGAIKALNAPKMIEGGK